VEQKVEQKVVRKPISNFFIKKSLQIRLITKIVIAALASTLLTAACLIVVYYLKYQTVVVYQLDKLSQELTREHIIFLIFPTLLMSSLVSLIMAFGIGLYSSRKYAVPIYKLEQWVTLLQQGKMGAMLRFREKEEMKDLSDKCNMLAADLRFKFMEIRKEIDKLKQTDPSSSIASKMEKTLAGLELESDSIEVNTTFYTVEKD
jgi:methyl-accepting chemotaxis protein